jgi:hypothetical protein
MSAWALEDLQKAITERLKGSAHLAGIAVLSREIGDIENEIEVQLAKIGLTLFVSEVELGGISGDFPEVSADEAQFTVSIYEDATTNTSGKSMAAVREIVMRRLHHFTPGVEGAGIITLLPDPENGRPKKKLNIRDIACRLSLTLGPGID